MARRCGAGRRSDVTRDEQLEEARRLIRDEAPAPGTCWRHFKGNEYAVLGAAVLEADLEPLVLYRPLGTDLTWARPLRVWRETVEVGGKRVARFTQIA